MSYLLDTHALLWSYYEPEKLGAEGIRQLTDKQQTIFVSTATLWEIAIKMNLGKLKLVESFQEFIECAVFDNGFILLPITIVHLATYRNLPLHHRDPFDRLLVAQAISESCTLISCDPQIPNYQVPLVW